MFVRLHHGRVQNLTEQLTHRTTVHKAVVTSEY